MAEGIIILDTQGRVQWLNEAALMLLELSCKDIPSGTSFLDLFQSLRASDLNYHPLSPGLNYEHLMELASAGPNKQTILCFLPSGHTLCVDIVYTLLQEEEQPTKILCQLHNLTDFYLQQIQISQNNAAQLSLIHAIFHLHDLLAVSPPEEELSIPSSIHIIGQHLADLIRDLLEGQAVFLFSLGSLDQRLYYIAFSGLTAEQTELRWKNSGRYRLADFLDPGAIEDLRAQKQVTIDRQHMHIPFAKPVDLPSSYLFWTPLFLKQELVGAFVLGRDYPCNTEESELVRAVATLTTLMIEYARSFAPLDHEKSNEMVLQATSQIIDAFLDLTSHELKTPLTTTMGNIQLALRRLEKLKDQINRQEEVISKDIERVQDPLEAANESARTQQQMIENMIDDAQIQKKTLQLHRRREELTKLIKKAVAQQQKHSRDRQFQLTLPPQEVWVSIDPRRINQVMHTYLSNAHRQSPANQPIEVALRVDTSQACISVHDTGPGIAPEEQEHIWERLYRSQGTAPQHELDLSMGIRFYLCRTLIEAHQGTVGVDSTLGHGTTFWFSLPLVEQAG
ncbi:sensor histidine kinase [Dictyobacter halimunensis]